VHIAGCDLDFQVIAVPGHTLGHIAYYGAGCLFCGDTLFAGGCGRLFEGTAAQMADSLARLAALPDETAVYCAHEYTQANLRFALAVEPGNRPAAAGQRGGGHRASGLATVPSTIGIEKASNPFLRCREPEVVAAASGECLERATRWRCLPRCASGRTASERSLGPLVGPRGRSVSLAVGAAPRDDCPQPLRPTEGVEDLAGIEGLDDEATAPP
jgi:hydroxyacylglutathione hydrolase